MRWERVYADGSTVPIHTNLSSEAWDAGNKITSRDVDAWFVPKTPVDMGGNAEEDEEEGGKEEEEGEEEKETRRGGVK